MPGEHVFQVKLVPYSNSEWERIVQNCTVVNILNWPIYKKSDICADCRLEFVEATQ